MKLWICFFSVNIGSLSDLIALTALPPFSPPRPSPLLPFSPPCRKAKGRQKRSVGEREIVISSKKINKIKGVKNFCSTHSSKSRKSRSSRKCFRISKRIKTLYENEQLSFWSLKSNNFNSPPCSSSYQKGNDKQNKPKKKKIKIK